MVPSAFAMRTGGFPGQAAAIKRRIEEIKQEGNERASRRMFLGLAVGGIGGLAAGAIGARSFDNTAADAPGPNYGSDPHLDWIRALAQGPIADLLNAKVSIFKSIAESSTDDPEVWLAVDRLANFAVERDGRDARYLRDRLDELRTERKIPAFVSPILNLARSRRK